jgi:hypothetical protein
VTTTTRERGKEEEEEEEEFGCEIKRIEHKTKKCL